MGKPRHKHGVLVPVSVMVESSVHTALEELARKERRSIAATVRLILDEYFDTHNIVTKSLIERDRNG